MDCDMHYYKGDAPCPDCNRVKTAIKTIFIPPTETVEDTQAQISQICDEIKELLIAKNKAYGDSALKPKRIFSKADALEQIRVRIDDKLSRISAGTGKGRGRTKEDTKMDLIGYLILEQIALRRKK